MRKIVYFLLLITAALSCDMVYFNEGEPAPYEPVDMEANTTIAQLKSLYVKEGEPVYIQPDLVIKGQVTTSDQSGNLYRSFYIQDETGGIEIKIGKSSLYSDYKIGQWVYVRCKGLTLGAYGGMVQLGYACESKEYETAYLDAQYLIDAHIFRGKRDTPLEPELISGAQVDDPAFFGKYVRLENLTYSNKVFVIIYDDTKPNSNSAYLSGTNKYGIYTWAMSENGFKAFMTPNGRVEPQSAFGGSVTAGTWQHYYNAASAYSVSQYFKSGSADLQVRTSGYAKFADTQIDSAILSGAKVNMNGILTYYNGNNQFLLNDLDGVEIIKE